MWDKLSGLFKKENNRETRIPGSYDEQGRWIGAQLSPWQPDPSKLGRLWQKNELTTLNYQVTGWSELDDGIMYTVRHLPWNIDCAVYSPSLDMIKGEGAAQFRETALKWIDAGVHPFIHHCWYVEEIDRIPRLFAPMPPEESLCNWMQENKERPVRLAVDLALQLALALEFLHLSGFVYRFFRPERVRIDRDGRITLLFSGTAPRKGEIAACDASPQLLKKHGVPEADAASFAGEVSGYFPAMAPECWRSPGDFQPQNDVYSFGVFLYELFCGEPPFIWTKNDRRPPLLAYKIMHLYEKPKDPLTLKRQLPASVSSLITSCIAREAAERPASFTEIVHMLTEVYNEAAGEEIPYCQIPPDMTAQANENNRTLVMLFPRVDHAAEPDKGLAAMEDIVTRYPLHREARVNLEVLRLDSALQTKEATILHIQDMIALPLDKIHLKRAALWAMVQGGEASHVQSMIEKSESGERAPAWIQNMKGIVLQKLDSPGQSLTAFEKAYQMEPFRWEYAYNVGVCWHRQGKYDEAEDYMEKAAGLSPDPRISVAFAVILSVKGKIKEAEEVLQAAYSHAPDSFWVNYHLGAMNGSMGLRVPGFDSREADLESAMTYLEKALKAAPGMRRIRDAYTECARRLNVTKDLPSLIFREPPGKEEREMATLLWKVRAFRVLRGHKEQVTSVAISWNGRCAATGGIDDVVIIWDPLTGAESAMMRGHEDWVRAVSLSADGAYLLSGSKDSTVRMWDTKTGNCLQVLRGHESEVYTATISYDGNTGISGGEDKTIRLWNLRSGECLQVLRGHRSRVSSTSVSYDCRRVLSGSLDKTIKLWDLTTGSCLKTFRGHEGEVLSVAMTPDGRLAVSGAGDGTIRLWDLENDKCLRVLQGHTKEVFSVDISADMRFALSGSWDETVRLWDLDLGECISVMGGHQGPVLGVALFADGRFGLTASRDKTVRMWEWKEEMLPLVYSIPPYALSTSLNAEKEVKAEQNYHRLMNAAKEALEQKDMNRAYVALRKAMEQPGKDRDEEALGLIEISVNKVRREAHRSAWCINTFEGHEDWVHSVAMAFGRRVALSGGSDTSVRVWDLQSGQCRAVLKGHGREVTSLDISPDGNWGLSGNRDQSIRLWNLKNGDTVRQMTGHTHDVNSVVFSRDLKRVFSGSFDNTVKFWDSQASKCLFTGEGHEGVVYCVALTPDAAYGFSVASDRTLRVWDLAKGALMKTLKAHVTILKSLAYSPALRRCATAGEDRKIALWDLESGTVALWCEGHEEEITSLSFTPDGKFLLSSSTDRTVRIWDTQTGAQLRVLKEHREPVSCAVFSPDAFYILSGSYDKTVKLWRADWEWKFDG
ncbi:MAG: protein kinase [Candidatus Xenobiia bacterium LiM19]